MSQIKTLLFDFDGVIANTEHLYDDYMNNLGNHHNLGFDNFAKIVKGTPMTQILKKYFRHLDQTTCNKIYDDLIEFEINMPYEEVPGSIDFIRDMKSKGYKIGLVTSSTNKKMDVALSKMDLNELLDTKVTSERITIGKPDPMCYLLAAKDLDSKPSECIVFEDSIHGVNSGISANMHVVGVTTTFSKEEMNPNVCIHIENFLDKKTIQNKINNLLHT